MFSNAVRDHRRPCEPQRFWSEELSKRWFGGSESTVNEDGELFLGSLCIGELRILPEDVAECKKQKNGVASLIVLVEVVLEIMETMPVVALLDFRAVCSSAKRENFNHVTHFQRHFVMRDKSFVTL